MEQFIELNTQNILTEHICCAISDKKCSDSYQAKKDWLKKEFDNGYVFRRLDARLKFLLNMAHLKLLGFLLLLKIT